MSKKNKKHIMLALDEQMYFAIKKRADAKHLPISTWVKLVLVEKMEVDNNGGK